MLTLICLMIFSTGCRESVKVGNNYITNVTTKIYVNDTFIGEESKILNLTMNEYCLPNKSYDLGVNFGSNVKTGDHLAYYFIFQDIQRPTCFQGFYNHLSELTVN